MCPVAGSPLTTSMPKLNLTVRDALKTLQSYSKRLEGRLLN